MILIIVHVIVRNEELQMILQFYDNISSNNFDLII